jgi:uncharacterized protein (DUF1499 family)
MARRRYAEQAPSRLAVWARWLALFSLLVALLAIVIGRAGIFEIIPVVVTFGAALALAALAILLALVAFIAIWRTGAAGLGSALAAVAIALAMLAYPAYLGVKAYRLPMIADITTDPIDPPRFEAIARLRSRLSNPIAYAGLYAAELQKAAYPDIEPLETTSNAQVTFDAAMTVVTKRRWQIINSRPPQPGRRDGVIEAVARSPIMGFRDDVVVRVRAASPGARVDARSASRYGRHDFGANAARLAALLEDIDDLASVEKVEKPARPQPKGQKPPPPPPKGAQPARR